MNTCIDCKHFSLKELPELARSGFGWCPHQNLDIGGGTISRSVTVSAHREICKKFDAAAKINVANRVQWLAQQETKKK